MFHLCADKTSLTARTREPVTSGSVNVYGVRFEFSEDWDGLTRTVVFKAGTVSRSILLEDSNTCVVPWEVLEDYHPFTRLMAGVYGTRDGEVVLPTVWASLGVIQEGAAPEGEMWPPTPELWRQALNRKQDRLTGLPGQVVGFDESGSAVPQDAAPGGGVDWQFGHGLKQTGNLVSVDTADGFDGDNTLPITAAAVQTAVGNIETLLGTI